MYAITGATGQLGRLVVEGLLKAVDPGDIVAAVRTPEKAIDLASRGVEVREADYDRPETLISAFAGVDRLLLVSSNEITNRVHQHRAVIEAAKTAGVSLIAYTSILHADRSPAKLADDHRATEVALASSGLGTVLLRNGWYTENYFMALQPALQHGAIVGSSGQGRVSMAARADYAAAAVAALTASEQAGRIYELAGDEAWTLSDLAAEISARSGRSVAYHDLPQADYEGILLKAGLPDHLASLLADADARAAEGALFDESRAMSRLIGRPTTPMSQSVAEALRQR